MPRSKSWRITGEPGVTVEIWSRRTHERSVVSPVGVQSLLRAVQSRLFCQTTLCIRLSPVFRSLESAGWPGWSAFGGKPGADMGTVVTVTVTVPGGVPVIVYTLIPAPVVVDVAHSPTIITATVVSQFSAMKATDEELRCWAGRMAKLELAIGWLVAKSMNLFPASISALFRTQYCAPIKGPVPVVKSITKSLAVMRNLSSLYPM